MPTRWLVIAAALVTLSGCASYTEKSSPCVCDWTPVSAADLVTV